MRHCVASVSLGTYGSILIDLLHCSVPWACCETHAIGLAVCSCRIGFCDKALVCNEPQNCDILAVVAMGRISPARVGCCCLIIIADTPGRNTPGRNEALTWLQGFQLGGILAAVAAGAIGGIPFMGGEDRRTYERYHLKRQAKTRV